MNLEIPDSFFREEEREGFLVTEDVKRCWAAEIKILLQVGEILDRHGLRWYADCGTLLGAVRHHGFVPWDDDIDIIMPRADYQQAWGYLRNELPAHFVLRCTQFDRDRLEPWGCVVNRGETHVEESEEEAAITAAYFGSRYQHMIDIYPLDYIPADAAEREVISTLYARLHDVICGYDVWTQWDMLPEVAQALEEVTGATLPRDREGLWDALWNLDLAFASMFGRKEACGTDIMYFSANTGRRPRPIDAYDHTVRLPFEMIEIPVPAGYAEVLRVSYGDNWLTPVRGSGAHEYPYFAATKSALQDALCGKMIEQAQALEAEDRMKEAEQLLAEAIAQFPDRYILHYLMACAVVEEDPAAAGHHLERALQTCDNEEHKAMIAQELRKFSEVPGQ